MSVKKLLLLALILLLLLFAYSSRHVATDGPNQAVDEIALFSNAALDELIYIGYFSQGVSYVAVRSLGERWELVSPSRGQTDELAVEELLAAIAELSAEDKIPSAEVDPDHEVYGLKIPEAFLRLKSDGWSETLSIGHENPLSRRRYVQLQSSGDIFLVPHRVLADIAQRATNLRNVRPFTFDPDAVRSVVVIAPGEKPVRILEQDGKWSMYLADTWIPTDSERVERSLRELTNLRAKSVTDLVGPEMTVYGLDERVVILSVELAAPDRWGNLHSTVRLGVGVALVTDSREDTARTETAYYIKPTTESTVYQFDRDVVSLWRRPEHVFRTEKLFPAFSAPRRIVYFPADSTVSRTLCDDEAVCRRYTEVFTRLEATRFEAQEPRVMKNEFALQLESSTGRREDTKLLALFRLEPGAPVEETFLLRISYEDYAASAILSKEMGEALLAWQAETLAAKVAVE